MSHRQQEKEARRRERMEREQAAARAAAARRRLQLVFGGLLAVALVAAVVVAVAVGFGGSDESSGTSSAAAVKLPEQTISDLNEAAAAAGCKVINPKYEGAQHETKDFKPSDYKSNPPTSGNHTPNYYQDGIYEPGTTPDLGQLVHTLEHGRIDVQYKPGTPAATVAQLEALLAEQDDGYHMLLFENTTQMKYAVAATAWTHLLGCPQMNDRVFDALRAFRTRYIDKGPETVP